MDNCEVNFQRMMNLIKGSCELVKEEQANLLLLATMLGKIQILAEWIQDEWRDNREDEKDT